MTHCNNVRNFVESPYCDRKTAAIQCAYEGLSDDERKALNDVADKLALQVYRLGRKGAIEVLGKLGILGVLR